MHGKKAFLGLIYTGKKRCAIEQIIIPLYHPQTLLFQCIDTKRGGPYDFLRNLAAALGGLQNTDSG